jgi:hypothetical protein
VSVYIRIKGLTKERRRVQPEVQKRADVDGAFLSLTIQLQIGSVHPAQDTEERQ